MKYVIFLGDGMADWPLKDRENKTPLMIADKPSIDSLARNGRCGQLITVPEDLPPGSSVANMGILGYDQHKCYQGRGVLEAASMGVEIKPGDLAVRCNLISIDRGKIKSHSAGHISSTEARELITYINEKLGSEDIHFYPGVDYRHLLVIKGASNEIKLVPPHDVPGTDAEKVMPKSKNPKGEKTRELLDLLIRQSWELLEEHPVNRKRIEEGKNPANSIWPWSPGYKPKMESMAERFGIKGAVISAVDLIRGLGLYAGLDLIPVDGITGKYDTNYEAKADACIEALKKYDFVYLHVEASDEAGHDADTDLKIRTIEYFDERLIKRVLENLYKVDDHVAIAVLPDHPTPLEFRTHVREPVPFLIYNPDLPPDNVTQYDEESVKAGCYGLLKGDEFIVTFLSNR